jgi:MtN3 and saliva related transmembrane protein
VELLAVPLFRGGIKLFMLADRLFYTPRVELIEERSPLAAMPYETLIGTAAALCTTVSYFPQVKKSWMTGETGDISLKMLLLLASGLGLWMVYGFVKSDVVIVAANGVSVAMVAIILYFKLRGKGS